MLKEGNREKYSFRLRKCAFSIDPKEILDDLFEEELIKKKIIKDVLKQKYGRI